MRTKTPKPDLIDALLGASDDTLEQLDQRRDNIKAMIQQIHDRADAEAEPLNVKMAAMDRLRAVIVEQLDSRGEDGHAPMPNMLRRDRTPAQQNSAFCPPPKGLGVVLDLPKRQGRQPGETLESQAPKLPNPDAEEHAEDEVPPGLKPWKGRAAGWRRLEIAKILLVKKAMTPYALAAQAQVPEDALAALLTGDLFCNNDDGLWCLSNEGRRYFQGRERG